MLLMTSSYHIGPHPLLVLIGALLLDAAVGDMPLLFRTLPHPVVLVGRAIAWLDIRLNREQRSEHARFVRGILTVCVLVVAAALLGFLIQRACEAVSFGWLVELIIVAVLVAQRSLFDRVRDVAVALNDQGLVGGRTAVAHIVGRDPASLDAHGVARAGIESLAENFSDSVVAPVFWTLLLGLPGLFVYKTANTLDSMIGHMTPRYRSFGWAAARFDDALNLVPARLSGLLIALAAGLAPQARFGPALRIMLRDSGKHRSPNSGWPEAAIAGALDLALAGPRRYAGEIVADPWLGDGKARATPLDMHRALLVFAIACILQGVAIALLWVVLT
ncbi:MAG: cobD [Rhodospirillales bacterium]|nr:cobD [Rhodospirillales bacterium]